MEDGRGQDLMAGQTVVDSLQDYDTQACQYVIKAIELDAYATDARYRPKMPIRGHVHHSSFSGRGSFKSTAVLA